MLSVCACNSCVLCMYMCTSDFSLQRRKGLAGSKSKQGSDVCSAFPWSTAGTGQAMAGFPILPSPACFSQGTLPTFQHTRTELQLRELMSPWAVLSLQKDILKTSSIARPTLPPSRLRLWLSALTMDRPARLCPQLLTGWDWPRNYTHSPSTAAWSAELKALRPGGRETQATRLTA